MMLPVFMNSAARMNRGIASSSWLAIMPLSSCSAAVPMSRPDRNSQRIEPPIIAYASGSPVTLRTTIAMTASEKGLVRFIVRSSPW